MTPRRPRHSMPAVEARLADAPDTESEKRAVVDAFETDSTATTERRRAPRFSCDLGIAMDWGGAVLEGSVVDVSVDGMFVTIDRPLWIGASFNARFATEPPVQIECVVRRVEPFRGMALTYTVPDQAERVAVADLLDRLKRT